MSAALSNVLPLFPDEQPKRRKKFESPALEDCLSYAIKIELPPLEARKFFHHYEMVGWVVGKARTPMKNWHSAMAGWKLRWEERETSLRKGPIRPESNTQKLFVLGTQLEQVEKQMTQVYHSVPSSANGKLWDSHPKEAALYKKLREERAKLQADIAKLKVT